MCIIQNCVLCTSEMPTLHIYIYIKVTQQIIKRPSALWTESFQASSLLDGIILGLQPIGRNHFRFVAYWMELFILGLQPNGHNHIRLVAYSIYFILLLDYNCIVLSCIKICFIFPKIFSIHLLPIIILQNCPIKNSLSEYLQYNYSCMKDIRKKS